MTQKETNGKFKKLNDKIMAKKISNLIENEFSNTVIYFIQGSSIRLTASFSSETVENMRPKDEIFKALKIKKNCQPRILYPAKLSLKDAIDIKTFPNKQKLKKVVTTRPALQEMLKGVL